ncbi:MAG TPA: C26 family cysteine hydrolase domain-containing family, partial [Acholeplasmataceae bacterium]|nr:C26 family cysteine hydrolase domain-containing family [Acholeplasmataceae bacterium]
DAETTEIDPNTKMPLIHTLEAPGTDLGGTLRLGLYDCKIEENTKAYQAYQKHIIQERHRHRYEFNNRYRDLLSDGQFVFSGVNPEQNLVEIIELNNHPWFVGVQYHPEFLSRPLRPHPLFRDFIGNSLKNNKNKS